MCYTGFVRSARFLGLPAAEESLANTWLALSSLAATLTHLPAKCCKQKTYAMLLSPLDATLTKNRGVGPSTMWFRVSKEVPRYYA